MIVYLASNNAHKREEIQDLLKEAGVSVNIRPAWAIGGMPEVEENADSFVGNARIKARALIGRLPDDALWVLADDSGLEVDALDGAPGIHSARYSGTHGDDSANNAKLLAELKDVPTPHRTARFRCVFVLANRAGVEIVFEGACEGRIAHESRGAHGFGYDPLFVPTGHARSFGELGPEVKAALSHRAKAVSAWIGWVRGNAEMLKI